MEVIRDGEGESVKYKPGGRLDMSHGFLRHIRRNQIASGHHSGMNRQLIQHTFYTADALPAATKDDYDREVKQAKEKQRRRHTNTPRRPRRPDRQVYNPRIRNGSEPGVNAEAEDWNESSSGTEMENTGTELFWLDYQADNGKITSFIVHKEDKPEVIVQRVAEKNVLDSSMRAALLARVGQEMNKRCDKR